MSRKYKNPFIFIVCIIFLLCLISCSGNEELNDYNIYNDTDVSPIPAPSVDVDSSQYESHLITSLSSGLEVDATIKLSDTINLAALTTYEADLRIQDFEEAKQLLLGNKTIVEDTTTNTKESMTNSPYRMCTTSDGFSLVSVGENLYFAGDIYRKISSIFDYSRINTSNLFINGIDLDFISIADAQKIVEEILQKLDIVVGKDPVCYTLDYDNFIIECENYNNYLKNIANRKFSPFTVNKSDECYIFVYQLMPIGLPISTHMNGVFGDGSWTSGTSVLCAYSANGPIAFQIDYQFEITKQNEPLSRGLNAKQVLEKLDKKFNSIILDGNYMVDTIEFEYVPLPNHNNKGYTLVPAWRVSVLHTYMVTDKNSPISRIPAEQRNTYIFHALTGAELLSDSGNA